MFELLPAIDLRAGRVVRLAQGDFGRETVYGDDPAALARDFVAAGASWLHLVDLDGARDGSRRQTREIERIVADVGEGTACQVAGGLRDFEAVEQVLATGARRVVVGTAALDRPAFAGELVGAFGSDRIVAALDIREGLAVGAGWVPGAGGLPVEEAFGRLSSFGISIFAVTSIERDGMLAGPDLDLLERLLTLDLGTIIASGGVSSAADIRAVRDLGCRGAIVGRALYEGRLHLADALLATAGQAQPPAEQAPPGAG